MVSTLTLDKSRAEHESSIKKIDELDLSMVKFKICLPVEQGGEGWTSEEAEYGELWYKRFLKLRLMRDGCVPTRTIDAMWHAHILETRKYHEDCDRIFGHYEHHFPYFGLRGEQDALELQKAFQRTTALFEEFFGEKPAGSDTRCGCGDCK